MKNIYIYIYRKLIHWLKLVKGRSKQNKNLSPSSIMSPLKLIGFSDE